MENMAGENSEAVLWYKNVAYEDAKELLKENLVSTVAAFITAGYWLKYIRDNRSYENDGYQNLWECAEKEFGLKISEASRAMSMNDKYSTDGNSPFMSESYKSYNKSQLQEMLTMTDEQIEQVTPDMTVKDIRQIKNPKEETPGENIENLEKLKRFMHNYVRVEYVKLSRFFPAAADLNVERLKAAYDEKSPRSSEMYTVLIFGDKDVEMVDPDTGEILAKYGADTVIEVFSEEYAWVCERKAYKIAPEVKGLMDDPYCAVCGTPLKAPDAEHMSDRCSWCGQAVEWSEYIKNFCDVAKDSVNTECEEESEGNICVEIIPESEEPLNVEFDTEELMKELDDFVDAEYREVEEDTEKTASIEDVSAKKCITGWSRYGACSCCGYNGAQCCNQCDEDCNSRCGWIDDPYIPEQEEPAQDDLSAIRQLLAEKNKELNQYLACEGIPEKTIYEKKTVVAALSNMVCELEDAEEKENAAEAGQPVFPEFKNNAQRKAWLEDVEAWGLWYEDQNIQARYYKYDFSDGSRLVAVKYRYTCPPWLEDITHKEADGSYKDAYYHMIYSEEYKKNHKYEYENYYTHSTASISTLVEFIKEINKKEKIDE